MDKESKDSNLNNEDLDQSTGLLPSDPKVDEDKNSSNDSSKTDKVVDDIVKEEGDELLQVQDEKKESDIKKPWYKKLFKKKIVWLITAIVIVLAVAFSLPFSRYWLLGLVIKKNYSLQVLDSQTKQPISDVKVSLDGKSSVTNNKGQANLKIKVGKSSLKLTKTYYLSSDLKVLVGLKSKRHTFYLIATGRQVPISVLNKISNKPIGNAEVAADGTTVHTASNGKATIVLPANKTDVTANVTASGFNSSSVNIKVTSATVSANNFSIVPSGKIYFLSNASGTIDVVSTNLDGSNRQTVLPGTGDEDSNNTQLYMSSDGQYVALMSRRSGTQPELYLITTSNNKLTTIDNSDASFAIDGWDGDYLIYTDTFNNIQPWQSGQNVLKSFNANTDQSKTLDQSTASGTSATDQESEAYDNVIPLSNGTIIYTVGWDLGYSVWSQANSLQGHVYSISPNGSYKKTLSNISVPSGTQTSGIYITTKQYAPSSVYMSDGFGNYYNYSNGQFSSDSSLNDDQFNQVGGSNFFTAANGNQAVWSEVRDGQDIIFSGSPTAINGQQIASLNSFTPYNWYQSDYILLVKNNSQLYVMPASGLAANQQPFKIADFFNSVSTQY